MNHYQVLFSGEVAEGAQEATVRNNLSRELGIDERKIGQLFSGRTVVIRSQLSQEDALALQARGIREIPVYQSVVFRNRKEEGLKLLDEELRTWAECLHRYDHIGQFSDQNVANSDAINGFVGKLYKLQTMNVTKRSRVSGEEHNRSRSRKD